MSTKYLNSAYQLNHVFQLKVHLYPTRSWGLLKYQCGSVHIPIPPALPVLKRESRLSRYRIPRCQSVEPLLIQNPSIHRYPLQRKSNSSEPPENGSVPPEDESVKQSAQQRPYWHLRDPVCAVIYCSAKTVYDIKKLDHGRTPGVLIDPALKDVGRKGSCVFG